MPSRPPARAARMPRMPAKDAASDSAPPLEPDADTLRRLTDEVARYALDHVAALDDAPAWSDDGVEELVRRLMQEPVPEAGRPLAAVLDLLDPAVRTSFNN